MVEKLRWQWLVGCWFSKVAGVGVCFVARLESSGERAMMLECVKVVSQIVVQCTPLL